MKTLNIILLFIIIFNYNCIFFQTEYYEKNIGQVVEKKKFNLIGILGKDSVDNYIELLYSEANPNGNNNTVVHKWVKPPIIIGGHYTNVTYNLIEDNSIYYKRPTKKPIIGYSEDSSHFMKIINHSSKQIEYFIAGTQDIFNIDIIKEFIVNNTVTKIDNGGSPSTLNYVYYPKVIYKNASIYFLLNPSEKPKTNQYFLNYELGSSFPLYYHKIINYKIIYFENNKIGDLIVDKPWTIEEVMDLYRKEFSNGNTLTLNHYTYRPEYKDEDYIYHLAKLPQKYYGFIKSGYTISSSDINPLITTDNIYYY